MRLVRFTVSPSDILVGTQDNGADEILLKVLRHAVYAARKLEQFDTSLRTRLSEIAARLTNTIA